jgi:hypothetical protein
MVPSNQRDDSFISTLVADGLPLLSLTGVALVGSGLAAFFLSATRHFLPHDIAFLGMTPQDLCDVNECRIVHFMIHDRVAFGGALVAIGTLYLWLVAFPLRERRAWAWWALFASGLVGFGSFLAYLGYGYLDTWHGVATLALLPCFMVGMMLSWRTLASPRSIRTAFQSAESVNMRSRAAIGRILLLVTAACMAAGGLTIMTIGMTTVFVPQDLAFMGLERAQLDAINPRLIPLIAHDRAGFGGGVATCGITLLLCLWRAPMSRHLWQAVGLSCFAGFSTAILIHPAIGYNDFVHLLPAFLGVSLFLVGWILSYPTRRGDARDGTMA